MDKIHQRISLQMREDIKKYYNDFKSGSQSIEKDFDDIQELVKGNVVEGYFYLVIKYLLQVVRDQAENIRNTADFTLNLRDMTEEQRDTIWKLTVQIELLAKESTNKKLTNKILEEIVSIKYNMKKIEKSYTSKINDTRKDIEEFSIFHDIADDVKKILGKNSDNDK